MGALILAVLAAPPVTHTLEEEFVLDSTRIEVIQDGRTATLEEVVGLKYHLRATGSRAARWTDAEDQRTFERLEAGLTLAIGRAEHDVEEGTPLGFTSPLVGHALRWDEGAFEFAGEDPPEGEWLEGLLRTAGPAALTGDAGAAAATAAWLRPYGAPPLAPAADEEHVELTLLLAWTTAPLQHLALDDPRLTVTPRDDGDHALRLTIDETVELGARAEDLLERLELRDALEELVEGGRVQVLLEGEGLLEDGRATFEADVTTIVELEFGDMLVRIEFEGVLEQVQTWR